ncbi:signal peptide peptidase SppA [Leptolyngbya sp. 15MV]|nr:signal peptide peptidase SppA [Leptolyngbya sp. 15MV]
MPRVRRDRDAGGLTRRLCPCRARDEGAAKIVVFAEMMGPTELSLGAHADKIMVQSGGAVTLPGMYMEEMFLADTLRWIGVQPDFVQIGDYKGASEMFANSKPSEAWNNNINQLLDGLYANMRSDLKVGRKMDDARLDRAMEKAWMATAEEAVKLGLVDAAVDLPALGQTLSGRATPRWKTIKPKTEAGPQVDASNPFAAMSQLMGMFNRQPPTRATRPTIAVLHVDGQIIDGDSTSGGFGGGTSVGSRTIRNALEQIRGDDLIRGVVVRIDSPGGSAIASEIMWQGIRRVAERKPVWVSVGSMAASGGYYLAVAGDRIYVNPSSIVGSIGVVGGKFSLAGVYEHLKVNVVGRARGPMASMFASTATWTDRERALVRTKMQETYDLFTRRVAAGRKGIDLSATAEGRLFTGERALELKMADKIGTLEDAIQDLASSVGMEDYAVMDFPAPKPLNEVLEDVFSGFGMGGASSRSTMPAEMVAGLRALVGEAHWPQVARAIDAIMVLRHEPVALVMPSVLIVR